MSLTTNNLRPGFKTLDLPFKKIHSWQDKVTSPNTFGEILSWSKYSGNKLDNSYKEKFKIFTFFNSVNFWEIIQINNKQPTIMVKSMNAGALDC